MDTLNYIRKNIVNPPKANRPVQIIHHHFPHDRQKINEFLDLAVTNELGGFCINMDIRPPKNEGESEEDFKERSLNMYLAENTPESEEAWEAMRIFIDGCFERGMKVWLYDERAFPSGGAGQGVLKAIPDSEVKGLVCKSEISKGGNSVLPLDRGTLRFAAACPAEDNILHTSEQIVPEKIDEDNIYFSLPQDGREYRMFGIFTRPIEYYTCNAVRYVDIMRKDVTDKFIEITHAKYLRKLGRERFEKIEAVFTDEPSLPVHGCSSRFYEKGGIAPWTEEMEGLIPDETYIDLFFDTERDFAETRRIWWHRAEKLLSENYFKRISDFCEKNGTKMTGHLYGEETLSMQIGLNASLFGVMRNMSAPGVDRLYCTDPRDVIAEKTATSAAHLYGKKMTMSENSFHLEKNFWKMENEMTPENRLNSDYYQKQMGLSNIASYFPGEIDNVNSNRMEYELKSGRTSMFIGLGTHKTDVLVLIPMNGAYSRYAAPDHKYWPIGPCIVAPFQPESIQVIEKAYGETLLNLEDGLYDFDLTDEQGLSECIAEEGKIFTKYETFREFVIFDSNCFEKETERFIVNFLKSGGNVTAIRTDIPTEFVKTIKKEYDKQVRLCNAEEICDNIPAAEKLLDIVTDEKKTVRIRKSVTEDCNLWFIHNRGEEKTEIVLPKGEYRIFGTDGSEKETKGGSMVINKKDAIMAVSMIKN